MVHCHIQNQIARELDKKDELIVNNLFALRQETFLTKYLFHNIFRNCKLLVKDVSAKKYGD